MFLQNKNQIRQHVVSFRSNLLELDKLNLQNTIANRFNQFILPLIREKNSIAIYYPANLELNILPALEKISMKLLLPVIDHSSKMLKFYPWKSTDKVRPSKYIKNILEPSIQLEAVIPDVVIAPLIACDVQGNRIGSGKAMYDTTIAALRIKNPQLIYIGICYDFQVVDYIPVEEHDQKLDIILTESRIIN